MSTWTPHKLIAINVEEFARLCNVALETAQPDKQAALDAMLEELPVRVIPELLKSADDYPQIEWSVYRGWINESTPSTCWRAGLLEDLVAGVARHVGGADLGHLAFVVVAHVDAAVGRFVVVHPVPELDDVLLRGAQHDLQRQFFALLDGALPLEQPQQFPVWKHWSRTTRFTQIEGLPSVDRITWVCGVVARTLPVTRSRPERYSS